MLFAVYSCDTADKCGDGQHLAMVWEGSTSKEAMKKMLRKVYKRKAFFGIRLEMAAFLRLYDEGGLDAVNASMEYGLIDPVKKNEWING